MMSGTVDRGSSGRMQRSGSTLGELVELLFESRGLCFELTDDRMKVEGKIARSVGKLGVVIFAGGLYAVER